MKVKHEYVFGLAVVLGLVLVARLAGVPTLAQGPVNDTFTYQGRLRSVGGAYVNDTCDFQFTLWDDPAGGAQVGGTGTLDRNNVVVRDGYFTVDLDFGDVFAGDERYLQIAVRCPAGSGGYDALGGRMKLNPSPYALAAQNAAAEGLAWSDVISKPAGFADDVDDVVTYTAGFGLNLTAGNEFSVITSTFVNTDTLQRRVAGACSGDQTIQGINADGSVRCATARPVYVAGEGIDEHVDPVSLLSVFEYDADVVQERVTFTCDSQRAIRRVSPNGSVYCEAIPQGDIEAVNVGGGLAGGGDSGPVTVTVAPGGIVSGKLITAAVTSRSLADAAVTGDKIADDAVTTVEIADGSILLADIGQNGCTDRQMMVYSTTAWVCGDDAPGNLTGGAGIVISGTTISARVRDGFGLSVVTGKIAVDFAGSGGSYGTADTVARSDHAHSEYVQPGDGYSKDVQGDFTNGFQVIGLQGHGVTAAASGSNKILKANSTGAWEPTTYVLPISPWTTRYSKSEENPLGEVSVGCGDSVNEVLVSGGCDCEGNDNVEDSYPSGPATWYCNCENTNKLNVAYVVCMKKEYP